ncbi:hypothetical protein KCU98_g8240, partial [Aureobasidium melanogenum]
MDDTTHPRFDYLDRLPPEIRGMIFAFMVQNTIQTDFRKRQWNSAPELEISDVKSHLISSAWVTLNKQYCIEYLKAFLREVELEGQITRSGKGSLGSDITELRDCLKLIKHRLEIAGRPQVEDEALFPYIKGICLGYYFGLSIFERGFGKTERRHRYFPAQYCFVKPVQQLRRYHEQYNIPSDKLSILVNYGDPTWTIQAFVHEQEGFQFDFQKHRSVTLLRPVQARIQLHNYNASVAAIDRELEVVKDTVDRAIKMLRLDYSDHRHLTDLATLEAIIQRDMMMLRRFHLDIIDEVTKFWKGLDG